MSTRIISFLLIMVLLVSLVPLRHVSAHVFSDEESIAFLTKTSEVKVITGLMVKYAGNKDAIHYYTQLVNQYWTVNDTKELNERNPQLASTISSLINATIAEAEAGNGDKAGSNYFDLSLDLEKSRPVRVDPMQRSNSTIQAQAIFNVVKESLEKYREAINSPVNLNLASTNSSLSNLGGKTLTGTHVVNEYAYEDSKALAKEAENMFKASVIDLDVAKTINNDKLLAEYAKHEFNIDRLLADFKKYMSDLDLKADPSIVMNDIYVNMYQDYVQGYGLAPQIVPEFPLPQLIVLTIMAGVILMLKILPTRKIIAIKHIKNI